MDSFDEGIKFVENIFRNAEQKTKEREKIKGRPIHQIENYLNSQVMEDSDLVKKIIRVGLSTYSNNPLNLCVMAPTSEGKTFAVTQVIKLFPKEDVMIFADVSPTALIYDKGVSVDSKGNSIEDKISKLEGKISKDTDGKAKKLIENEIKETLNTAWNLIDLSGKILVFLEPPNIELWRKLKTILSHDKTEIQFKVTEKKNGQLTAKNTIMRGWPVCIFCTAKNEKQFTEWDEIETRFIITSPNTNISKYKKANLHTGKRYSIPDFAKGLYQNEEDEKYARYYISEIKDQMKLLGDFATNPVCNIFHRDIAEVLPSNEGPAMRIAERFFSFCNLETLINADKNCKIIQEYNGEVKKYVLTYLRDIESAIDLVGSASNIPLEKVKFFEEIFVPVLASKLDGVTTKDLAEKYSIKYGKQTTPKKILETYLKPLCSYGIVDWKENPVDKKQHLYYQSSDLNVNTLEYVKKKIIEESKDNDSFVKSRLKEMIAPSSKIGRIHIEDYQGNHVNENQIQIILLGNTPQTNNSRVAQA